MLVLVMIPFIVVMGLRYARPLSLQFSRLRDAAKDVTGGQFGRQAELIEDAPAEMIRSNWSLGTRSLPLGPVPETRTASSRPSAIQRRIVYSLRPTASATSEMV